MTPKGLQFRRFRASAMVIQVALWIVAGGLAGEIFDQLQMKRKNSKAESFRKAHPEAFSLRPTIDGWDDSLWAKQWNDYKPGARLDLEVGGRRYSILINSLGYRTREFSASKPSDVVRVVCIGGSTTIQGETNATTYPAQLEDMLRSRHPSTKIEVLNLGVSGVDSAFWASRGYRFLDWSPDVVVQYEGVNDLLHLYVPQWAAEHPFRAKAYKSLLLQQLFPPPENMLDQAIETTLSNIGNLTAAARTVGARHVVGTFAAPASTLALREQRDYLDLDLYTEWSTPALRLSAFGFYERLLDRFNRRLQIASQSEGFVLAPVAGRVREPDRFVDVCHMNALGIRELASAFLPEVDHAVADAISRRGLGQQAMKGLSEARARAASGRESPSVR
jgi:lysophospholipase L1-like esterase